MLGSVQFTLQLVLYELLAKYLQPGAKALELCCTQLETVYVLEGLGPPPEASTHSDNSGAKTFEDQVRF